MSRIVLLAVLIYILVLTGILTLNGSVVALAIPLAVYLGAGLVARPPEPKLRATRSLSASHLPYGTDLVVRLNVTNDGAALERVLVEDRPPAGMTLADGELRLIARIGAGETVALEYTLRAPRGAYAFGRARAAAGDTTGLFVRRVELGDPAEVFVLPRVQLLRQVQLRPRRTRISSGQVPARVGGAGVEFFGVRQYQPGDPLRWVNDRVTARHQEAIFVNEFQQERAADIGLILDTRRRGAVRLGGGALFEQSVEAAASLAAAFLTAGNRVGLLLHGGGIDWVVPGHGKVQRERILRALAHAGLGDSPAFESFDELPLHLFPQRAQLVLVSPLLSSDLKALVGLRARGRDLLVISTNPVRFEQQMFGESPAVEQGARLAALERGLLLRRLQEAGVIIVDWDVKLPFVQVAQQALRRPPPMLPGVGL
jgi:uncharacterized protein (DUF58 family)